MTRVSIQDVADKQVLYLTTIGRRTGLPREIEIWFVIRCERFYLFAETGEAAGWVKNIRRNPEVSVRIGERQIGATARVLPMSAKSPPDQIENVAHFIHPQQKCHAKKCRCANENCGEEREKFCEET